MKLVIAHLQLDAFKRTPIAVQVMVVNELGVEQSRFLLPISMFSHAKLEVGQELILTPKSTERRQD